MKGYEMGKAKAVAVGKNDRKKSTFEVQLWITFGHVLN
jgi:hypothetical protein